MKIFYYILVLNLVIATNLATAQQDTISNVFTPNADGMNDNFVITSTNITSATVNIYNRYGAIVYSNYIKPKTINTNTVYLWDGVTNAGLKCPEGTYFYVISLESEGAANKLSGYVTLLR